ncbi:hypothetical protein [Pseudomonas mangrovi]|jgi:hypothetical protein|uniref:hypothetical protein n=1 Tax=Pseudomonas mangrovi TaxID=2161748 RepID=UPI0011B1E63D|nr:hypothetical protein [Pseudomonas mangrovi]
MFIASMLGKSFDSLGFAALSYREEYRDWLSGEGESPDWAIELNDCSLQFLLTQERKVKTVFVLEKCKIEELLSASINCTLSQLQQKLGPPSREGSEIEIPILGKQGAWVSYEKPTHVLHVQFEPGGEKIKMVTLMSPDYAP